MFLLASDPRFNQLPQEFRSPFPSNSTLLSAKFQALGDSTADVLASKNLTAMVEAAQLAAADKAMFVGDFLLDDLLKISFESGGQWLGLFSRVAIGTASANPAKLASDLARTAISVGLSVISAVPIVGQIIAVAVSVGKFIYALFQRPTPEERKIFVPLSEYSKSVDTELIDYAIRPACSSVDWTSIFRPPFVTGRYWDRREADDERTTIYGPWNGNELDFTDGLGAMPGTMQIAGQIQLAPSLQPPPNWLGPGIHRAQQIITTDCGRFFPAAASFSAQMWQWANRPGNPDSFKIDTLAIESQWALYWETFYSSLGEQFQNAKTNGEGRLARLIGNVIGSYLVGFRYSTNTNLIGVPGMDGWFPNQPMVTPDFRNGLGESGTNHPCFYRVSNSKFGVNKFPLQSGFRSVPKSGNTCIPFPPAEATSVSWKPIFEGLIQPAIHRLRSIQWASLRQTLISAYVRPDPVGTEAAYSAFEGDPLLAQECRVVRELLLKHEARFRIRLVDVDDIDPIFADRLRESGVDNSPGQFQQSLGRKFQVGEPESFPDPVEPSSYALSVPTGPVQKKITSSGASGAYVALSAASLLVPLLLRKRRGRR